jgi:hypothetical protein
VGLAEGVAAGARRWVAHGWDLTLWVAGHMVLPKRLGKHLRGSACVALGHAKRPSHPALPPFWAARTTVAKSIVVD